MNKRITIGMAAVLIACTSVAQVNIIPKPVDIKMPAIGGTYTIKAASVVAVANKSLQSSATYFTDYVKEVYQVGLQSSASKAGAITLSVEPKKNAVPGTYTLHADKKGIVIKGVDAEGVFYGVQSLIQLLPLQKGNALTVAFTDITDYPRFAYRGMHLDAGRHFFPASFVKKYIDYLARHKMNYFHWHLTEDQGWRIEIKKYPKLTQVGGFRNGTIIDHYPGTGNTNTRYGGFYTQEEIKEVVAYAAKRYITVVPEIELPGHSSAAIAAYPQLSCFPDSATKMLPPASSLNQALPLKKVQETWGVFEDVFCPSEYTFNFLQDVLDEVIALFPSKYIHIGGDECPKDAWKKSAFCQDLMKKLGLKTEHELQSYFIQRIEKYINGKGRQIIGWDEILEGGLAPNAVVMSWRGEKGGVDAAKEKHAVIMSPESHTYFNYSQALSKEKEDSVTFSCCLTVEKVYGYEPVPLQLQNTDQEKYVLGAQANVWSEYIHYPSTIEYQVFPRMSALSEVLWSQKSDRNWADFSSRLRDQFKRYDLWKVNYNKGYE
ncbi:hexosaminidase [Filimonas lacunae]|uniref:beta-N-acetylhexosaminidase n=1 Tax=Filimonas lacunae TaxID=477680 RepID=A0A173MMS3_9BACT|nr:beta-N-acetylhexosaminidase [Filimonas lacunae]BAV08786.1 beta-hexosaminidase [Filimonas lacunae]SIS61714.1 hexosaminidase [Filimonas lacunae]